MSEIEQYDVDTSPRDTGPGPGILIAAAVVVVAGVLAWLFFRAEPEAPVVDASPPVVEEKQEPLPVLGRDPEPEAEPVVIPDLDESDSVVGGLVASLTAQPELVAAVAPDRIVRRFVAVVDNIADGVHPRPHMADKFLEEPYRVETDGETRRPSGANAVRVERWVDAFTSIDPVQAATLYRQLQERFGEAYRDLGYPNREFDDTVVRAMAHLLSTPLPVETPELEQKVESWAYADDELEGLSPVQKQLLRLGPDHQRRIDAQIRAIATALGIPDGRLPGTPIYQPPGG